MKRKLDATSISLGLLAGTIAGACGGYFFARSRESRKFATRLDEAVAEVKEHYSRPLLKRVDAMVTETSLDTLVPGRVRYSDVVKAILQPKAVPDQLEGIGVGSDGEIIPDEADGGSSPGNGSDPDPEELVSLGPVPEGEDLEEPPFPFEISRAQYGELAEEGFQMISVTYYADDRVLCENDDPIRDVQGTVGTLSPLAFGGASGDPNIRYVRNRRLRVDFEICLDARSFAETVLGYGQPNKQREKSPRPKAVT